MGTIEKRVDIAENLTIFTVVGKVEREVYEKTFKDFYEKGPVTKFVLFDLTRSVVDHLDSSEVYSLAQTPRTCLGAREGGKTAIVAPSDLTFGLARMFEFTTGKEGLSFDTSTFRTTDEAMQWLKEG